LYRSHYLIILKEIRENTESLKRKCLWRQHMDLLEPDVDLSGCGFIIYDIQWLQEAW